MILTRQVPQKPAPPQEATRSIHINRPGWRNGRLVDAHNALEKEDYPLLKSVLERCQPWSLTLEYNRDESQILTQAARLKKILAEY